MSAFGMKTFVGATPYKIKMLKEELSQNPDHLYASGAGKKALFLLLLDFVRAEDIFFDDHPEKAKVCGTRWSDFMDDCLLLAVLGDCLCIERLRYVNQYDSFQDIANEALNFDEGILKKRVASLASSEYFH